MDFNFFLYIPHANIQPKNLKKKIIYGTPQERGQIPILSGAIITIRIFIELILKIICPSWQSQYTVIKIFYVYLNVLCEDSKDICMGSKAHGI